MKIKRKIFEVEASDWPVFCQRISEEQSGATVNVEVTKLDEVPGQSIISASFESMVYNATGACSNVITLRFRDGKEIVHEILDPIHIQLKPSEAIGDFNPLEIRAENGLTTITFHPAIHGQMLVGLRVA